MYKSGLVSPPSHQMTTNRMFVLNVEHKEGPSEDVRGVVRKVLEYKRRIKEVLRREKDSIECVLQDTSDTTISYDITASRDDSGPFIRDLTSAICADLMTRTDIIEVSIKEIVGDGTEEDSSNVGDIFRVIGIE